MAAASVVQEIHNVLQVCGISELVTHMRLKDNKGFNSFKYFGVINRDTDVLKMSNFLASRNVTTRVNLGAVKIKGLQDLVWWVHDRQTHNQLLITDDFEQDVKRAAMTGKWKNNYRAETDAMVSGLGKFKAE